MISFSVSGNYDRTKKFLHAAAKGDHIRKVLDEAGSSGVEALMMATPVDSGATAKSWTYDVEVQNGKYSVIWRNTNFNGSVNVAIILQYGHGTGTGGYVQGVDYINPALRPIFEKIANKVWKAVTLA